MLTNNGHRQQKKCDSEGEKVLIVNAASLCVEFVIRGGCFVLFVVAVLFVCLLLLFFYQPGCTVQLQKEESSWLVA